MLRRPAPAFVPALALVVALVATACSIDGNGIIAENTYPVNQPLQGLVVGSFIDATVSVDSSLTQGAVVVIRTDANLMGRIEVELGELNRLELDTEGRMDPTDGVRATVRLAPASAAYLHAEDASRLAVADTLRLPTLTLKLEDAATGSLNLAIAQSASITTADAADLTVAGTVPTLTLTATDASQLRARDLEADTLRASTEDAATAEVHARVYLRAWAENASTIRYRDVPGLTVEQQTERAATVAPLP